MKKVVLTKPVPRRPSLRAEQAQLTRQRIESALVQLLGQDAGVDAITFAAVARLAGVTEMTVYRHFPTRKDLLQGLWEQVNREMGQDLRMPENLQALHAQHAELYAGFDRMSQHIMATITTPQGREVRAALNRPRRKAFTAIVREVAPALDSASTQRAAAVIQLLHSAYAWASLREQWGLSGPEAGKATRWAIDTLIDSLRRTNS